MKRILGAFLLLAAAGCSSYSEIARWDSTVTADNGERPVASFITQNFDYKLLYCVPLCTGRPWTEGEGPVKDDYDVSFFESGATVENNLKSLDHALDLVGSHRVANLRTKVDDSSFWSFFIINRHEVRTQCLILPDRDAVR